MKIFFTSDTHAFHTNIIKSCDRPFIDSFDMNTQLIDNWNSVVSENDLVYHLGDVAFKANPLNVKQFLDKLNGRIRLVKGNHDKERDYRIYSDRFEWIKEYHEESFTIDGKKYHIVMFHFPIDSWNRKHYGSIHCCGHSHNKICYQNGRFDVGVDSDLAQFRPILINDIIGIHNGRKS